MRSIPMGWVILPLAVIALAGGSRAGDEDVGRKIAFDLERISDDGLTGAGSSRHSVGYEFCVPDHTRFLEEVRGIDPSVTCYPESPGRVGCSGDQRLCMGNTRQAGFRNVLKGLASLPYVDRIAESYYE
jgi:hypothetical protein